MKRSFRSIGIATGLSALIAGAANLLILLIVVLVDRVPFVEVPGRAMEVGVGPILTVTVLVSLVGSVVAAVLARWRWGRGVFVGVGLIVTFGSLVSVASASTTSGAIALGLMHVATGVTVIAIQLAVQRWTQRDAAASPSPLQPAEHS